MSDGKSSSPMHHWIIILLIIIFGLGGFFLIKKENTFQEYPEDLWQAVFIDNGQVYFGHVKDVNKNDVVIENIYYLQVVAQPLQRSFADTGGDQPDQQLTLIKLGNEIHGPQDAMDINRQHVVLIENLKSDSRVAEAITNYEENR